MLFSIYIVQIVYLSFELECEKNENKQKEAGIGPFFEKNQFIQIRFNKKLKVTPTARSDLCLCANVFNPLIMLISTENCLGEPCHFLNHCFKAHF